MGVFLNGAANLATAVHTWNDATSHGGKGIVVRTNGHGNQNRLVGCYLDFTDLRIVDPTSISVTNGFFLGGGRIELVPNITKKATGVYFAGNEFQDSRSTGFDTVFVNRTIAADAFTDVMDVSIEGSMVQEGTSFQTKTTRATKAVVVSSASKSIAVDFSDVLLFLPTEAPIRSVQYSLALDGSQFATSAARLPGTASHVLTIDTDTAITGTVTVTVDQSMRTA